MTDDERLTDLAALPVDPLDDLIERGLARSALISPARFSDIPRVRSSVSSAEILRDVRGRW